MARMERSDKKLADLPLLELATDLDELYKDSYTEITVVARNKKTGNVEWANGSPRPPLSIELTDQQLADLQKQAQESASSLLSAINIVMGGIRIADK